jgi:hypothetical protein
LPPSDLPICHLPTCPPFLSSVVAAVFVVADSHSNSQLSFDQSPLAAVFVVAVFVAADSRSNRQPSFDQSPVAIRHSLPPSVVADSPSNIAAV